MNYDKVSVLKSLADETRLSIVRKLAQESDEIASAEIIGSCANALNLSQPAMSHHFQKLVTSGVLSERKSGTEKRYTLNKALLSEIGIDYQKL